MQKNRLKIRNGYLTLYDGLAWHSVHLSNVICIEKELRKMTVYYLDPDSDGNPSNAKYCEFFLNEALSALIENFDNRFFVCKRGCLINFKYVRSIEGNKITLENSHEIILSRRLMLNTIREYEKYLGVD